MRHSRRGASSRIVGDSGSSPYRFGCPTMLCEAPYRAVCGGDMSLGPLFGRSLWLRDRYRQPAHGNMPLCAAKKNKKKEMRSHALDQRSVVTSHANLLFTQEAAKQSSRVPRSP